MQRRRFLQALGGAAAGVYLADTTASAMSAEEFARALGAARDEERFWRLVRMQFLFPTDYAYLNTGGLGASPLPVIKTVKDRLDAEETFPSAGHSAEDFWAVKEKCARFFGPGCKKEELALIGSATEGINIILNGLGLGRGDEVIISAHEHVALNIPLLQKMKTSGVVIRSFEPDMADGQGNVGLIEELIGPRTRLIFLSHVTCTTGQLFPVRQISRLAREKGVLFALDGAQALINIPFDIKDIGVDFYTLSGHKWLLGPKRTGLLYVREELLDELAPTVVGAYSDSLVDMPGRRLELHPTAQRYEYATQNDALIYGLGAAVDFVSAIGVPAIWERNRRLAGLFLEGLQQVGGVRVLSPAEQQYRTSMITFRFEDRENGPLCSELVRRRLRVRSVGEAGLDAIRVSFHVYNSEAEVRRLLESIRELAVS